MGTNVAGLEKALQKTLAWLDELIAELGWDDRRQAYAALRATLHALRDRLPVNEAADLAAQLPLLLRGVYYEGWKPAAVPNRIRHKTEFLTPVERSLVRERGTDPEAVARAVFALLSRHVSSGEIEDVRRLLPPEIQQLFPKEVAV